MEMLAEDSDISMGLPPKKHAFRPLVLLFCESEQIDSTTQYLLSLKSKDESDKHALCSI
jgi:hypothetical protein